MNKQEIRVTDPTTGGQKGSKLAQVSAIPADVLLELAEHYGKGRSKYPDTDGIPNYAKGFAWSLSFDAAMRHLLQFWSGEDRDDETGSKHAIAAAWHCINLALLMETHPEKDDRWRARVQHNDAHETTHRVVISDHGHHAVPIATR